MTKPAKKQPKPALVSINRNNVPSYGDLLVPKPRKKDSIDPVIVIAVYSGDRQAVVKDQSLVERDPKWDNLRGGSISQHPDTGAIRKTFRELAQDYLIDLDRRAAIRASIIARMKAKGEPTGWLERAWEAENGSRNKD